MSDAEGEGLRGVVVNLLTAGGVGLRGVVATLLAPVGVGLRGVVAIFLAVGGVGLRGALLGGYEVGLRGVTFFVVGWDGLRRICTFCSRRDGGSSSAGGGGRSDPSTFSWSLLSTSSHLYSVSSLSRLSGYANTRWRLRIFPNCGSCAAAPPKAAAAFSSLAMVRSKNGRYPRISSSLRRYAAPAPPSPSMVEIPASLGSPFKN